MSEVGLSKKKPRGVSREGRPRRGATCDSASKSKSNAKELDNLPTEICSSGEYLPTWNDKTNKVKQRKLPPSKLPISIRHRDSRAEVNAKPVQSHENTSDTQIQKPIRHLHKKESSENTAPCSKKSNSEIFPEKDKSADTTSETQNPKWREFVAAKKKKPERMSTKGREEDEKFTEGGGISFTRGVLVGDRIHRTPTTYANEDAWFMFEHDVNVPRKHTPNVLPVKLPSPSRDYDTPVSQGSSEENPGSGRGSRVGTSGGRRERPLRSSNSSRREPQALPWEASEEPNPVPGKQIALADVDVEFVNDDCHMLFQKLLAERNAKIEDLQELLNQHERTIQSLQNSLQTQENTIKSLEKDLLQKEMFIENCRRK